MNCNPEEAIKMKRFFISLLILLVSSAFAAAPAAETLVHVPVIWQRPNAGEFQITQAGFFRDAQKYVFAFKINNLKQILSGKANAGLYWNCDGDRKSGRFPNSQGIDVQFNIDLKVRRIVIVRWLGARDRHYMTLYEDDYLVENNEDVLYIALRRPALSQLTIKDPSEFLLQLSHQGKRTQRVFCRINPKVPPKGLMEPPLKFTRFGAMKSSRIKQRMAFPVSRKKAASVVWDCRSERFSADEKTPAFSAPLPALQLKAARGETGSVFFAVETASPFSALKITPLQLTCGKKSISAKVQKIQYADYIANDRGTLFTDILFDSFPGKKVKRQFAVWHVAVPRDAAPGVYKGKLQLQINGKQDRPIPVELRVYNFALPKFPAMRSAFSVKNGHISARFPDSRIRKQIYNTMVSRAAAFRFGPRLPGTDPRFKLDSKGKLHIDWSGFDARAKYLIGTLGVNTLQLPPGQLGSHDKFIRWNSILKKNYKNTADPEFQSVYKQYVRAYADHIKKLGIADKMLFVVWDEPYGLEEPLKGARLVREAAPEIPIGIFIDRYEPSAGNEIDIWLTTLQNVAKTLKGAKGKRVWLYNSNGVNNFRIPAADLRSFFFLADRHGIEGFLSSEINVISKTGIKNGTFFNHYPQHCLFYVSEDGKKVYDSWRLVLLRQGFNDYDYLSIYRKLLAAKGKNVPAWLTEAEPDFDASGLPDFKIMTTAELDRLKERVAAEIEKLLK